MPLRLAEQHRVLGDGGDARRGSRPRARATRPRRRVGVDARLRVARDGAARACGSRSPTSSHAGDRIDDLVGDAARHEAGADHADPDRAAFRRALAPAALSTMIMPRRPAAADQMPHAGSAPWKAGSKSGQAAVLGGDLVRRDRPGDAERRVVEAQPALPLRRIGVADEVERLGVLGQRQEACAQPRGTYIMRRCSASAPRRTTGRRSGYRGADRPPRRTARRRCSAPASPRRRAATGSACHATCGAGG